MTAPTFSFDITSLIHHLQVIRAEHGECAVALDHPVHGTMSLAHLGSIEIVTQHGVPGMPDPCLLLRPQGAAQP